MTPTIEWANKNFDKFNEMYFGGELVKPKFRITKASRSFGTCSCKLKQDTVKRICYYGRSVKTGECLADTMQINLSKYWELNEKNLEEVLIHEMIHLMFFLENKPHVVHGPEFVAKAKEITGCGIHTITIKGLFKKAVNENIKERCSVREVYILRDLKSGMKLYVFGAPGNGNKKRIENMIIRSGYEYALENSFFSSHPMFDNRRSSLTRSKIDLHYFRDYEQYKSLLDSQICEAAMRRNSR